MTNYDSKVLALKIAPWLVLSVLATAGGCKSDDDDPNIGTGGSAPSGGSTSSGGSSASGGANTGGSGALGGEGGLGGGGMGGRS